MKEMFPRKTALAGLFFTTLLVASCQSNSSPVATTPTASSSPGYYTGQALPSNVESLSGTPLYSTSVELAEKLQLPGAPFLLIAPQNPEEALLVLETGADPAEMKSRASQITEFSGVTETADAKDFVEFAKSSYQLNLKTDDNGKLVILRIAPKDSQNTPASPSPMTPGKNL